MWYQQTVSIAKKKFLKNKVIERNVRVHFTKYVMNLITRTPSSVG